MKALNFLLVSLLLLAPVDYLGRCCGACGAFGQADAGYDIRKNGDNFTIVWKDPGQKRPIADKQPAAEKPRADKEPLVVKVHYEPTSDEICEASKPGKTVTKVESRSVDPAKEAAAKWKASLLEKTKNHETLSCRQKMDSINEKSGFRSEPKKVETLCADCYKCEAQIKSTGDGVVLKCQQCRQVPSDQVAFPSGNSERVIRLP